ncbi:MAG: dipeptide epimerase [Bacteroidales bacterium]|jgi:L-alanine-DL-glutamate epimerase-like enolase superfamily enzyme|nr:dipeptide epimerase [Bacteroidales bacterium]
MKIIDISPVSIQMKLAEPYTIAYETIDKTTNIFLRLNTSDGITGYGCAAPDLEVTGETGESVLNDIYEKAGPRLRHADPTRLALIMEDLKKMIPDSPSVLAMVDMALYDILGKKAGLPVYKLLGGFRDRIRTSITIGILPAEETVSRAKGFVEQGFRVLKIKGGIDVEEDIERILKVREMVGSNIEIRFDANQGYTVEGSVHFVNATKKAGIEILEQPTSRDQLDLLGKVTSRVDIPVMADESLMNLKDVFKMARRDLVDMINIKLMKVGGISEAMHINSVARAAGYESMVGCMDESALAIAAGLHFALARPNVAYADLDGHLDLIGDPCDGAVILKNGILYPTNKPGLGFDPDL